MIEAGKGFARNACPTLAILLASSGLLAQTPTFSRSDLTSVCPSGVTAADMASGDFNGDHKSDLAVLCSDGKVSLLLGKGDGSFQQQIVNTAIPIESHKFPSLVAGDFDRDGRTDLAIAYLSTLTIVLFPGGAPSVSKMPLQFTARGYPPVIWADVNGDGVQDLILVYGDFPADQQLSYLPGRRDGTFAAQVTIPLPGASPCLYIDGLGLGDLNGDGIPDIALGTCDITGDSATYVLLGKGSGVFAAPKIVLPGISAYGIVLIGDFNGDGKPDMVFGGTGRGNGTNALLGNGDGTFRPIFRNNGFSGPFIAADFNGDGKPDLAQPTGGVAILLSQGDGTFQPLNNSFPTLSSPFRVLSADFNADGKPDLAVLSATGVTILLNTTPFTSVPHISAGGVVGAGLSTPTVKALSSKAIASVFGDTFAPAGTVVSTDLVNGRLPTVINAVCVYVNNVPAPIFFLGSNQINFQVPQIPISGTVGVQVATSCGTPSEIRSPAENVAVAVATPEFFYFTHSADGKNPIAAINAINGNYIGPAGLIPGTNFVPAAPGDILTLFFTGGGATAPAFAPGELPGSGGMTTSSAGVSIGTTQLAASDIQYAGVAPGFAGLYQLNIQIPAGVQPGNQPVVLTIGGSMSPAGYLSIGPGT